MAKLGAEDNRADLAEMVANEARETRHIAHAKIEFAAHVHVLVEECADVQGILGGRHDKIVWEFVDRINGGMKHRMEDMTCEEEVFLMEERWSGGVNNVWVAPMCDLEKVRK